MIDIELVNKALWNISLGEMAVSFMAPIVTPYAYTMVWSLHNFLIVPLIFHLEGR